MGMSRAGSIVSALSSLKSAATERASFLSLPFKSRKNFSKHILTRASSMNSLVRHSPQSPAVRSTRDGMGIISREQLVEVQAGAQTTVLMPTVSHRGEERFIGYRWGEPGSHRVGINLDSVQTGLTRVTEPR